MRPVGDGVVPIAKGVEIDPADWEHWRPREVRKTVPVVQKCQGLANLRACIRGLKGERMKRAEIGEGNW